MIIIVIITIIFIITLKLVNDEKIKDTDKWVYILQNSG